MTYQVRKPMLTGLSGLPETIGNVVSQVAGAVGTVAGIANDPYAGELTCRIKQVITNELGGQVTQCPSVPLSTPSPAGLRKPVAGMRAYIWAEQRKPWSYPAIAAVVVGVPFLLGYLTGRK